MAAEASDPRSAAAAKDARRIGLSVLGELPLVAETPPYLLDDETTPTTRLFLRNNGLTPEPFAGDPDGWAFTIDGEVETPLRLTLGELERDFAEAVVSLHLQMECGGNGRSFHDPPAHGNPWTVGGVGCSLWTGVPLGAVLARAGVKPSAVYTGHYGADVPVPGSGKAEAMSRGVPMAKALEPHTLLAYALNGEPLPHLHGGPLRLVVPGWPGSCSQKWLTRIWVRDREHDGEGMRGTTYRLPVRPVSPGETPDPANYRVLESMPVRSIITSPVAGTEVPLGPLAVRGAAWAGDLAVRDVELSADGGRRWTRAELRPPRNRYDWQRWTATVPLPGDGPVELWSRATDMAGNVQPARATNWNPQGYGANPYHRVAVTVG